MSAAATWVPIAISGAALALSATGVVLGEVRRRSDKHALQEEKSAREALEERQAKQGARIKIREIIDRWQHGILGDSFYAGADQDWGGLLESSERWRHSLVGDRTALLTFSKGEKTKPYLLLNQTVDPAKQFEDTVRPIVERWKDPNKQQDPTNRYEDVRRVLEAVDKLQREFNRVVQELLDLDDDQLIERAP